MALVDQILEDRYHANRTVLEKVVNLDAEEVANHILGITDFKTKLKTFDISGRASLMV